MIFDVLVTTAEQSAGIHVCLDIWNLCICNVFLCSPTVWSIKCWKGNERDEILPYICSSWLLPRKEILVTYYMATWFKTKVEFLFLVLVLFVCFYFSSFFFLFFHLHAFYEQPNRDYPNGYGYLYLFVNKNSLANHVRHLLRRYACWIFFNVWAVLTTFFSFFFSFFFIL